MLLPAWFLQVPGGHCKGGATKGNRKRLEASGFTMRNIRRVDRSKALAKSMLKPRMMMGAIQVSLDFDPIQTSDEGKAIRNVSRVR